MSVSFDTNDNEAFQLYALFVTFKAFFDQKKENCSILNVPRPFKHITFEKFLQNREKRFFYVFGNKRITSKKFLRLCMCGAQLRGSKFFISSLMEPEILQKYMEIQKWIENFPNSFREEHMELISNDLPLTRIMRRGINYPLIVELYFQGKVSIGFLVALNRKTKFLKKFNDEIVPLMNFGQKMIWETYYYSLIKWDQLFYDDIIV